MCNLTGVQATNDPIILTNICKLLPQVHSRYCIYLCVCLVMKKSSFSIGIFGDIWYAATEVVVVMQGSNYVRKSEEELSASGEYNQN